MNFIIIILGNQIWNYEYYYTCISNKITKNREKRIPNPTLPSIQLHYRYPCGQNPTLPSIQLHYRYPCGQNSTLPFIGIHVVRTQPFPSYSYITGIHVVRTQPFPSYRHYRYPCGQNPTLPFIQTLQVSMWSELNPSLHTVTGIHVVRTQPFPSYNYYDITGIHVVRTQPFLSYSYQNPTLGTTQHSSHISVVHYHLVSLQCICWSVHLSLPGDWERGIEWDKEVGISWKVVVPL